MGIPTRASVRRGWISICVWAVLPAALASADETTEKKITFDEHIKPIFREHCTACHSESDKESDLALDTYGATLTGGSSGEVIAEGNSGGSRLFALITHAERPFMPPDQDPIAKEQIELVKTWIEQGMPENSGSKIKRSNSAATAMLSNVSLGKPDGPPPMPVGHLKQPVIETKRSAAISAIAASPWAPLVAVAGQMQVSLYHSGNGELLGVIPFPEGEPQSLTFTRDGKQLLIGGGRHSHSGCAVLVDVATGERITKVGDELDTVLAADISPDKSRIAIAGPQKTIRIFDSLTGDLVFELKKHTDWVFALRFSPDGVLLASGDRSNGLIVWEADNGRLYSDLVGHKGSIRGLDFRADSNVLLSGSLDGTIKLWDMAEVKEIKSWNAHGGGVTAVSYANSGLVASAGRDAKIKTWNGNGELQKEFKGLGESALEVALTGDATSVAGGDWNGNVQLWKADDPAQSHLIVANPPSIQSRLTNAQAEQHAIESELAKLADAAKLAVASASTSKTQFDAIKKDYSEATAQVGKLAEQKSGLATQVGELNTKIQELEKQLAAHRAEHASKTKQLEVTSAQHAEMLTTADAKKVSLEAAQKASESAAVAAAKAVEQQKAVEFRLAAVQSRVDKALADQAALQARDAELAKLATEKAKQLTELGQQLQTAQAEQDQQATVNQQLSKKLETIQTQLAEVQAQLQAALDAQKQAQGQLNAQEQKTEKLKAELSAAEQAAADAKAQRELFEKSYRRPPT